MCNDAQKRGEIDQMVVQLFTKTGVSVGTRIKRIYTILLLFTLKVGCHIVIMHPLLCSLCCTVSMIVPK